MPIRPLCRTLLTPAVLCSALGLSALSACGDSPEGPPGGIAPAGQEPLRPLGFEVWHADFPGAPELPHLSPRQPGRWYDRTRRQALESIAEKLQGNCSRDAWLAAKDFFSRLEPDEIDVLVEQLDRALQSNETADLAENTVEAIGRAHAPAAAPSLLRALEHPKQSIRNKAMQAMIGSGTPATVRAARGMFHAVDGRGIEAWIRAARDHLPDDEIVQQYRSILADPQLQLVWQSVVDNAIELPVPIALAVFEPMFGHEPPALLPTICGLRHAAGDAGGTSLLGDLLRRPDPQTRRLAVQSLRFGGAEDLLDHVLRLTADPDPTVRRAVVELLAGIQGENVDLAIEGMTNDEAQDVRRGALAVARSRGKRLSIDELIDAVRNGTGSRYTLAIEDLIAVKDGVAVAAMQERMKAAPVEERRELLRAMAFTTTPEAFPPLREVFLSDDAFAQENRSYVAYLFANCRGAEQSMLELFAALPKSDYRRRAMLMGTLVNVAADREDGAIRKPVYAMFRQILADRTEIPQIRLCALGYLRRDLRIGDMKLVRELLVEEAEPMRKALTDFLFEFY